MQPDTQQCHDHFVRMSWSGGIGTVNRHDETPGLFWALLFSPVRRVENRTTVLHRRPIDRVTADPTKPSKTALCIKRMWKIKRKCLSVSVVCTVCISLSFTVKLNIKITIRFVCPHSGSVAEIFPSKYASIAEISSTVTNQTNPSNWI